MYVWCYVHLTISRKGTRETQHTSHNSLLLLQCYTSYCTKTLLYQLLYQTLLYQLLYQTLLYQLLYQTLLYQLLYQTLLYQLWYQTLLYQLWPKSTAGTCVPICSCLVHGCSSMSSRLGKVSSIRCQDLQRPCQSSTCSHMNWTVWR